ncbi:MAG TPA: winged helix-turn-helix transcriptional regulator [Candidatus Methylacidiphilales bacterium]|nr:winged helix-turn-helix transcriptional regulator [Candidatus Methylacidiphilales bacterium]
MKSKLLRKLAKSQKYLILAEIKRSQGLSVSQLCERINLSYMGVKQHCVALEKDGYLDTWRRPKGMGRPEKAYRLTPQAQEFFPSEHTNFTAEILKSLEQVYGPAAPEKILYQIYQNQTAKLRTRINGNTIEERARSFAALRDHEGYMSEYYFNPDIQRHQIIEYNSPVLPIADQFKILTQLENALIESVLGVRVQREQERISGLYKCQFTLMD